LIGRAASAQLRIGLPSVSSQHAVISWSSSGWCIRDLASRNGTYLNGKRLPHEARTVRLSKDDELTFAEPDESWLLWDDAAPSAQLSDERGDVIELSPGASTGVPSDDAPLAFVLEDGTCWYLESAHGERTELCDGQLVAIGQRRYLVHLPEVSTSTPEAGEPAPDATIARVRLRIRVAANEEAAALEVELAGRSHAFPLRAHFYLLAILARQRIADSARRDLQREGWVSVERAMQELGLAAPESVAVLAHRCRKALERIGCRDTPRLIERQRGGLLRLGVPAEQCWVEQLLHADGRRAHSSNGTGFSSDSESDARMSPSATGTS
jgi:hypothetical protein